MPSIVQTIPTIAWIGIGAAIVLALVVLTLRGRKNWLTFMGLRISCAVPVVGKVAVLARDDQRSGDGWFRSEKELCGNFYRYYPLYTTAASFNRATSYLNKAQELGRRDMPMFGWAVVSVLLVAEALSFGILLAGYAAQNASLRNQTELGWLLAIVLAIVLLGFTHATGRQFHCNALLTKAREWFQNRPDAEVKKPLRPMPGVALDTDERDDLEPPYIHLANRVRDHGGTFQPSYTVPITTLIIVAVIGGVSFYMREKVYESIATNDTMTESAPANAAGANPNDINIILGKDTAEANERGKHESADNAGSAAVAGFGVLSVLFLAMQVLGVMVGFYFGFSGKESESAAAIRGRFGSVEEFTRYHHEREDYVARIAQSWLQKLQRKLRRRTLGGGFETGIENRKFQKYVMEEVQILADSKRAQADHQERAQANRHGPAPVAQPVPIAPAKPSEAPLIVDATSDAEAALRRKIEAEVTQKLLAEKEAQLRAEIETRERLRLGLEKPH